ncbi:MAG: linear amide C-N hydrolase [Verrucomicrobiales bacterium]|nr:linear amide C-N hydrolase [Verrucomicrobiales bacterium]
MKTKTSILLGMLAAAGLFVDTARPCTSLVLETKDDLCFARNLDWFWEDGLVIVNQRNLKKRALLIAGGKPAEWTSQYGSVTFNQMGQELPFGGMNEAGLVVENMMLYETRYPERDERPEVNMVQWIQYQLDTCATVDEVLATDRTIRMEPPVFPARIHYLICDRTGASATIEFLGGRMVVHHGGDLPNRILSNSTYEASTAFLQRWQTSGEKPAEVQGTGSLERFARAAQLAEDFGKTGNDTPVDRAFAALENVHQPRLTVWSIVYEPQVQRIHYRTRSRPETKVIEFKQLDFACGQDPQYADLGWEVAAGTPPTFQRLTPEKHRAYLEQFFARESVIGQFGDLRPMLPLVLGTARSMECDGKPARP